MKHLLTLRASGGLYTLAPQLGYSAKTLAYVVYGIPDAAKYNDFQIDKRSGGKRTISAPIPQLKTLQKRLCHLIDNCISEIDAGKRKRNTLSHGFRRKHSIMTNAASHRRSRYVFNIDLHDFFGTINFGRVSGFFEKNRSFNLNPKVARILAQIACHNKSLPQGSPCSPIISNLIGHIIDVRMMQLAARAGCHYSRYADDLTFSTNKQYFPNLIATRINGTNQWAPSKKLRLAIKQCGFDINDTKTRMQFKDFRQDVTGIIVNSKLNVRAEYARNARAMVHSLVTKGEFYQRYMIRNEHGAWEKKEKKGTENQLRGILSFIESVRHFEAHRTSINPDGSTEDFPPHLVKSSELDGFAKVYRRFLLFTLFFKPEKPIILCEGKTDNVYLRCALRRLAEKFPLLATTKDGKVNLNVNFFNYTKTTDRILHLGGGTGDIKNFISQYGTEFKGFSTKNKRNPVLVVIDNDGGSSHIFATIKEKSKKGVNVDGNQPHYSINDNLYVIPIPKIDGKQTTIENFFEDSVLKTTLHGKTFSGSDKFDPKTQYGKHLFAEQVIKKKEKDIDFSKFEVILQRLNGALADHMGKT